MLSPNRRPQHGDRVLGCRAELSIRCCAGTEGGEMVVQAAAPVFRSWWGLGEPS